MVLQNDTLMYNIKYKTIFCPWIYSQSELDDSQVKVFFYIKSNLIPKQKSIIKFQHLLYSLILNY